MERRPSHEAERKVAVEAFVRARQRLTLDHFVEFERVEEKRRRSEGQLLIDWYVLLHRSNVMQGVGMTQTDDP